MIPRLRSLPSSVSSVSFAVKLSIGRAGVKDGELTAQVRRRHPCTLVYDPGPPRRIAAGVRRLERALPVSGASRGVAPRSSGPSRASRLSPAHTFILRGCYNASHLQCMDRLMKTKTLPPLRVTPELRRSAESVLGRGETLSAFVLESVARNIEARRAQQAFIERGLASAERARNTGKYVSAEAVMRKLS